MKFSIITSSLNVEKTVGRCIESVLCQKDVDVEHIIVDGLSADSTGQIIRHWAQSDDRLKYIIEKDEGIYDAWNKGVEMASGEWILFLGADDFLINQSILGEIQSNIRISSDKLGFISCRSVKGDVATFDFENIVLKPRKNIKSLYDGPIISMPDHPALFHSRAIFLSGYRFDQSFPTAADKKMFLELSHVADIQYMEFLLTFFSLGGVTNRSGNLVRRWFEKNRLRKHFELPIVPYYYYKSFLGAVYYDFLHFFNLKN